MGSKSIFGVLREIGLIVFNYLNFLVQYLL